MRMCPRCGTLTNHRDCPHCAPVGPVVELTQANPVRAAERTILDAVAAWFDNPGAATALSLREAERNLRRVRGGS